MIQLGGNNVGDGDDDGLDLSCENVAKIMDLGC